MQQHAAAQYHAMLLGLLLGHLENGREQMET